MNETPAIWIATPCNSSKRPKFHLPPNKTDSLTTAESMLIDFARHSCNQNCRNAKMPGLTSGCSRALA